MILVDNKEGLIGDFLGTIPAMQKLVEKDLVIVKIHPEIKSLFELTNLDELDFIRLDDLDKMITLSSSEAFQISVKHNCYMTSAFMVQVGFELPKEPPKAILNFNPERKLYHPNIDYLISPFARSLPSEQKWPIENWLELVRSMPAVKFGVLGNEKYDEKYIWKNENNVVPLYNLDFEDMCSIYKDCLALISVVTGTSHLAFHLGVKNILLTNQNMAWGNNPDAIKITDYIPNITVKQVIDQL